MRKYLAIIACVLLLAMLPAAHAADMYVANCDEWVSLRAEPDKSSERLAKVWLGETVTDVSVDYGAFARCSYGGMTGYILKEYLIPAETEETVAQAEGAEGSAMQGVAVSDFESRYPEYRPLNGIDFPEIPFPESWSMGQALFLTGRVRCTFAEGLETVEIFAEADETSGLVMQLKPADTVFAAGTVEGWLLCECDGKYGWVREGQLII